ncbi:peptide MFS transporter [Corynebacterium nasicanis]
MPSMVSIEMWERFSFYGMQAILAYYLYSQADGLGMEKPQATALVGAYGAFLYLCTFAGGWIGDRLLGAERTLLGGAGLLVLGHLSLALLPGYAGLTPGLLLIALGSGLLKTAAVTILGQSYPAASARRDAAFQIFYLGINIGALLGPLLTGWLAARHGFHAGFAAAAGLMVLGVVVYLVLRPRLLATCVLTQPTQPLDPRRAALLIGGAVLAVLTVVALLALGILSAGQLAAAFLALTIAMAVFLFGQMLLSPAVSAPERQRVLAFLPLFLASTTYWALQAQIYGVLAVYSDVRLDRTIGNLEVPAAWTQSLNPFYILAFSLPLAWLWVRLGQRGPTSATKMGGGVIIAGSSMLLMLPFVGGGENSTPFLALAAAIGLLSLGEMLIGPVGMASTALHAPRAFATRFSALYFLTLAIGTSLAGTLSTFYDAASPSSERAYFLAVAAGAVLIGVVCLTTSRALRR